MNRSDSLRLIVAAALLVSMGSAMGNSAAETPRNLDTHHIMSPPSSREAWEARKAELREQILFSAGLLPMPVRMPLHPLVTGKIEGPDYTIENVALETRPGFYLCGNLYRPKGKKGPFPGIVNPHGHWANGRLEMQPDVAIADPKGKMGDGRGNLVSIGVNLARQGCIVFAYDMVGYNDTNQVSDKFAGSLKPWLWNVNLMGLQLWNSIRVVDYLTSLPDVDKKRIGVTGASGGGTQTFQLCAVDDRINTAVPVNMISAYMQGGCLCENGPGLRVGNDNVEVGAMMAPKPLMLVAATGDWTSKNPVEEWPAIKSVYDLYGAGDHTACSQFNYQHNYNVESREAMYRWFGRWLLHDSNPSHFTEKPFEADVSKMHVWTASNPMPSNALKEPALIQSMIDDSEKQLASLWPKDQRSLTRFQELMRPALVHSLAITAPSYDSSYDPARRVLIVSPKGDRTLADSIAHTLTGPPSLKPQPRDDRRIHPAILEINRPAMPSDKLWANFFTGYNRTPLGDNVQEIVDALARLSGPNKASVDLIGLGDAGPWALLARGISEVRGKTIVDAARFPSDRDDAYIEKLYSPGLRRAGDLRTAAMLIAPQPLTIFNTGSDFKTDSIRAGFKAVKGRLHTQESAAAESDLVGWLK